jgi:hypothetical protein
MANAAGGTSVASLQGLINTVSGALAQNGVNPQAALAAGGGGAAAPGVAPVAGAQAAGGGGIVAGGAATTTVGTFTTQTGRAVTLTKTGEKYSMTPATGGQEIVNVNGKLVRFDATGKQTTAFDQVMAQRYHVDLDRTSGISNGLSNLSKIFGANQEQVRDMSDALAEDAAESGSFDPLALQRMQMAQTTAQQMSAMEKSIFDSMKESIQSWLNR